MADSFKVSGAYGETLQLSGVLDQYADLGFFARLREDTRISLAGVRRIDSVGVRSWIDGLRTVPETIHLTFIELPPPIVEHLNMVGGFLGSHTLESFYAPMACTQCGESQETLVTMDACRAAGGHIPPAVCARCGAPAELDEVEARYLGFMQG